MAKENKKLNRPVKNGIAKTPVVMQMEMLECGAACLTMILHYYGYYASLEQVRIDCGVSRDGSNAKNILKAARHYGLGTSAYRMEPEALRKAGTFPCIIHWNFNHFVVCNGFKGDKVYINDPGRGSVKVSMEEFDESFTGICIIPTPGENFEPKGEKKNVFTYTLGRLKGTGVAIAFVILTMIIGALLQVINPAFSRIFIDRLLTGINKEWVMPFILMLAGINIIQLVVAWIQAVYSLRIDGKMAIYGNTSYMWKVLRLPMEFFSQRMAGDIQERQQTNATISKQIVDTLAPLVINTGMMLFYLIVMCRYSLILTAIGLVSVIINGFVTKIISNKRVNISRVQMRDAGKLYGTTASGLEMIETIKSSGAENGYFTKWSGYQASVNTQNVRFAKINEYLGIIPQIVSQCSSIIITVLGVYLTIKGQFTVGMIMAMQGFLQSFMEPANSLADAGATLNEMTTSMDRVDDVMRYETDSYCDTYYTDSNAEYSKLSGNVVMKNVTFGYSKLADPLIENFDMELTPGKSVAFVGASGCGKSTLAKLISGLYRPWSGEILFDGKPISEYDHSVFRGSVAVVDQDIILFEDTIAENIRMWDSSIEDFEVIMAARDAQIHDDIVLRENGYQNKLTEGGKNLSGGQRQRIEIARVLAQDPTIIIMDEATSALDAKTEYEVVKAIKERGITCIIVAHRLSTIRDCDEIIVMDNGKVVERGTHEKLYKNGGYYTSLISNE